MKTLNNFILEHLECPKRSIFEHFECPKRSILERLKLNKDDQLRKYKYFPKDFDELRSLIFQLLQERGKDADLNDIDVSKITAFYSKRRGIGLFYLSDPHNIKIDKWGVSKVENMESMFYGCENFNCNLSKWDVSKVENMESMFYGCENFNSDLSKWKVNNVKNMKRMFENCTSLKNKPSWYKG